MKTNTRKTKNRNKKFSRKHIGGMTPSGPPPPGSKVDEDIKARVEAEKLVNYNAMKGNAIHNTKNGPIQDMPRLSDQFNTIRQELIGEINKLNSDQFRMMQQNVINAIGNEGSAVYPTPTESKAKPKTIEDEIDEFLILISDNNNIILKPIHLYYIDCLLQSYMSKSTKFDLYSDQKFDQIEYDFVLKQTQLPDYDLKNKSQTFKTYIMNMLADILSHKISTLLKSARAETK